MTLQLKVKLLTPTAKLPTKAYPSDSGFDLYADLPAEWPIRPGERVRIPTGVAFEPPVGHEIQLRPRSSSLFVRGLHVALGTNDNGFRGESCAVIVNLADWTELIRPGEKLCQVVVCPIPQIELVQVEVLGPGDRGEAGWGSSGR